MLSQKLLQQMYLSDSKLLTQTEDGVWILTSALWDHGEEEKIYAPYMRTSDTLSELINDIESCGQNKKYIVSIIDEEEYKNKLFKNEII